MQYSYAIHFWGSVLSTLRKAINLLKKEVGNKNLDIKSIEYIMNIIGIEELENKIEEASTKTHYNEIIEMEKLLKIKL